jgi:hypothetical protein
VGFDPDHGVVGNIDLQFTVKHVLRDGERNAGEVPD